MLDMISCSLDFLRGKFHFKISIVALGMLHIVAPLLMTIYWGISGSATQQNFQLSIDLRSE